MQAVSLLCQNVKLVSGQYGMVGVAQPGFEPQQRGEFVDKQGVGVHVFNEW